MKKVFFALFAVVIAVGGSAFTNAKVAAVGTIYGSTSDDYSKRSTLVYDNDDCQDNTDKICAYQVTLAGQNIVTGSNYTDEQMQAFKLAGHVVEAPGSKKGIYLLP